MMKLVVLGVACMGALALAQGGGGGSQGTPAQPAVPAVAEGRAGPAQAARGVTTLGDLERQMTEQFRRAWPELQGVEITHFEHPQGPGYLIIGVRLKWDERTSTGTSLRFYAVGGRYCAGSMKLEGKPVTATALLAFE